VRGASTLLAVDGHGVRITDSPGSYVSDMTHVIDVGSAMTYNLFADGQCLNNALRRR